MRVFKTRNISDITVQRYRRCMTCRWSYVTYEEVAENYGPRKVYRGAYATE